MGQATTSRVGLPSPYRLLQVLKSGPSAQTLLATDHRTGQTVVIKALELTGLSREVQSRVAREGSLFKYLPETGMATVIDTVHDDQRLYVVMPHIDGVTLRERLESGPLTVSETLVVARLLLRSLAELHTHGAVHRDVKPANIMVDAGPGLRNATLVDFGIAATAYPRPDAPTGPTGSDGPNSSDSSGGSDCSDGLRSAPRYMAPELAGVLDRPVDTRADLYAAGIVLYECLAGRPPFLGEVAQTLRQHLSSPPPRLRTLGVRVPQILEEILRRLLHKDPDDRYRCAEAVLADIEALEAGLREGLAEPGVTVGARDSRQTLTEPPLTGREEEMALLGQRLVDAGGGAAAFVVLEAGSGGGKSSVLTEFCQRASASGARIFRGQGIERSAPQPLQMLAGIVDDLVENTDTLPAFRSELVSRLGVAAGPLCAALPRLCEVLEGPTPPPATSEAHARVRLVRALITLLDSLGDVSRPAVIALDDCQWADELTLEVLEAWVKESIEDGSSPHHVLIIAAVRADSTTPFERLAAQEGAERLPLPPLDDDQIRQVIESMAGPVPPEAARVVAELSRGNPLMVSAVLRGLVEANALAPSDRGWRFAPAPGHWQASRQAATLLARRFALLDPATRELLDAGAVLGSAFALDLAALLVNQNGDTALEAIKQATERHLVWDRGAGQFAFVHDRLRTSLLMQLEPGKLGDLHRRAAEVLELRQPELIFDLSYHFDAAGESQRALAYSIRSAEAARVRHDFELAERQYRMAERGMNEASGEVQCRILEALGQLLMLRGHYDESAKRFEAARALANDDISVARIEGQLGELVFRRDDLDGAGRHIEAGLRVLGEWFPTGRRVYLIGQIIREVLRRCLPSRFRERRAATPAEVQRDRLRAHLYTQLQYPRWFDGRRLETLWLMLRQVNIAERCPGTTELAHAYAVWAGALALTLPMTWRRALRYIDRSLEIYQRLGDLRGEGHAASMRACVLHSGGQYQDACESAGEGVQILGQFGDRWELGFAARNRAVCLYRLGRLTHARNEAQRLLDIGFETGDEHAKVTALEVLAKASDGRVPAALTQAALGDHGRDIELTVAALQTESLRLRNSGRLREAITALTEAADLVRRAQPTSTHLVPVFAWLATLHREHAERPLLPHVRRRRLKRALRSSRRAARYGRIYPNDQPHALRELGIVHALSGHRRRARWHLTRSYRAAQKRQAAAELVQTRLQFERLEIPHEVWAQEVELPEASAVSAERSEAAEWGLADRLTSLLDAGVRLAAADSSESIAQAINDIALSLLRAERCRLVGLTKDWGLETADLPEDEREIAGRAAQQNRPLVVGEYLVRDGSNGRGPGIEGARSALCAPIFVHGAMTGYFLALHSQVNRLFGEEEVQLAQFVARLAGAVLEREKLQRDSRTSAIAAQEFERARVARDLHDDIGQALTSVLLTVRLVESAVSGGAGKDNSHEVLDRVAELRRTVASALESVQRLAFDLRPAVLDDLGLLAALRRLTTSVAAGSVEVELESVDLDTGVRLSSDIETTAYRIAQESITNVVRHAGATRCGLIVGCTGRSLRVVVEDDGVGFDEGTGRQGGLGIVGMKERAALVGGTLRVTSEPAQGTQVVFEVLLDRED
jgi:two-component system sensor kinase